YSLPLANSDSIKMFEWYRNNAFVTLDNQMCFGNGPQPRGIASVKAPDVAIENQYSVIVVRPAIPLLRVSQIHGLIRGHRDFGFAKKFLRFERESNLFVDLVDFIPTLGDDDRPMFGLHV